MFSPMSSYITQLKKIDLSSISFDGHFDVSNIEMLITNNSLKVYMTEAGEQSGDNPERKTLFDFQNQNSGEDTYCKDYTPSGFRSIRNLINNGRLNTARTDISRVISLLR